jgi:predicted amidophosphoribosyltransferase
MPDPRNAEYQRTWRERQAGRLPPVQRPVCPACGITHTGSRGVLCSRCWERLTEEGKEFRRERVRKARRKRDSV